MNSCRLCCRWFRLPQGTQTRYCSQLLTSWNSGTEIRYQRKSKTWSKCLYMNLIQSLFFTRLMTWLKYLYMNCQVLFLSSEYRTQDNKTLPVFFYFFAISYLGKKKEDAFCVAHFIFVYICRAKSNRFWENCDRISSETWMTTTDYLAFPCPSPVSSGKKGSCKAPRLFPWCQYQSSARELIVVCCVIQRTSFGEESAISFCFSNQKMACSHYGSREREGRKQKGLRGPRKFTLSTIC